MHRELVGLSSMATRPILADLCEHLRLAHGTPVRFESAGGVEVARRVREGAEADLLVLAAGALAALEREGHLLPGTARRRQERLGPSRHRAVRRHRLHRRGRRTAPG
ncbi:substrate-binding domain-containing protein, partial [Streptomyces hydrogenans]|uniref:substrate-binding domain-containing protein n=1 Tax=Streptomyces hydrogenans TaxID=1873719 RepID=UPI00381DABB3